jgi:phage FluMu gp28-like protein
LGSRPSSEALPPVLQLRPYQQRWIDDTSRFKGAVKSARIGFSFATAAEAVLDCLEHVSNWTVLSASKAQSNEFIEEGVAKIVKSMGAVAEIYQEPFADELGATDILVQRVRFSNGSRIVALPANPRTARGYPGNAILDEFGHHEDSHAIFAAVGRQVALGHKLRVLSTPNGEQGKFFDLAKEFGMADGVPPATNPIKVGSWSWHWVDVNLAIREGCPINVEEMRDLFKDEETFSQEFLCVFIKAVGSWLGIDLVAMAEDAGASVEWPAGYVPTGPLYAGIDVARDRDKTVLWLDEYLGDVAWARLVLRLHAMPFPKQHDLLEPWVRMATRTAVDATGMGIGVYDYLNEAVPGRVLGINFAGTNDQGVKIKTDMAMRMKQRYEKHLDRIPRDPEIRQAMLAIKRETTATGVRFDAPRIEVDSPVAGGAKTKRYGHADEFWAKAMASLAAAGAPAAAFAHADAADPRAVREPRGALSQMLTDLVTREHAEGRHISSEQRQRRTIWS